MSSTRSCLFDLDLDQTPQTLSSLGISLAHRSTIQLYRNASKSGLNTGSIRIGDKAEAFASVRLAIQHDHTVHNLTILREVFA
jgi:hypothetical protein